MGTCECENKYLNNKELKYFFTRNKRESIKVDPNINKNQYTKKQRIINRFIINNISRLCKKEKYHNLKTKSKLLFFDKEELNFEYKKSDFEKKINAKIKDYFEGKENIIKELFPYNLIDTLHKFSKLREKICIYHYNDILTNHQQYLKDLLSFLNEKKTINGIEINIKKLLEDKNMNNNDILNNIKKLFQKKNTSENNEIMNKKKNNVIDQNNNSNSNSNSNSSSIDDMNKELIENIDILSNSIFIKKEINNFFEICFDSTKKNIHEYQKKSIFLNILIAQEIKKCPQISFTMGLGKLLKLLYYIYLLKKYNFLKETGDCFYKICPNQIRKKSILIDQILLNKRELILKNDNILKIKLLKKLFSQKKTDSIRPIESDKIYSMSSISSEEGQKECYSMISANDVKLLKSMTKTEEQIETKSKIIRMEEEKVNDNKTLFGFNREKQSFLDKQEKSNNFNLFNNIRVKKRTKTANKNKELDFVEYYSGQFDETIYIYAGIGTLVSQNCKKLYHGTFRYGRKEGLGFLYNIKDYNNIEYYMGEFHLNKIDGYGIKIKISDTQFIFQEGLFESDYYIHGVYKKIKQKENKIITYTYEGDFKDNKFTGNATLSKKIYIKDKNEKFIVIQEINYNGEFKNGEKNGKGKEIYNNIFKPNKNYEYEGNFVDGLKEGFGVINYDKFNFVTRYEGFFEYDKPFQRYGIVNFKSGDIYEGFFQKSLKYYLGLYSFYKSKKIIEIYFGGFLDDSKNGIGKTIVSENEEKMLIGSYKRGEKEGQFEKIIFSNILIGKLKRKKNTLSEDYFLSEEKESRKNEEILPRTEIKNYPVYEENEIIDFNENYFIENN